MIILILINIVIIYYIYSKYYKFSKTINEKDENIKDKDSIVIGYINDRTFNNNFDLIVSEIIELNIKGYITIEYSDDNDKYNYIIKQNVDIVLDKINKYEIIVLNYLFSSKTEITKKELEEKINDTFCSYNTRFNEIEKILDKQLLEENIIDEIKQKELAKKTKMYIKISIILILIVSVLGIFEIINISATYILIYILEKLVSSVLLLKASIYTDKGQAFKYSIDNYKIKLQNERLLTNKVTMKDIVLKKEFADSIALHVKTQEKEAFIDDRTLKETTRISKKTLINIFVIFAIFILLVLIMHNIIRVLPLGARIMLYVIMIISVALTADITLYKKK